MEYSDVKRITNQLDTLRRSRAYVSKIIDRRETQITELLRQRDEMDRMIEDLEAELDMAKAATGEVAHG